MQRILVLIIFIYGNIFAQSVGSYYNPKDDQYRLLGVKRAKEVFDAAQSEFKRQNELIEKGLISSHEFEKSRMTFIDAEVNYHQSLLALLFEQQYVSVINAVKYQSETGRKKVNLTLANSSGGGGEFKKLINIDDELFNSLQPEIINDVYISLLNDENAIISQPYEAKIEELIFGNPETIEFELLQDVDAVTVNIIYGSGTQRAPKIFLQKDASANRVVFQSDQFSQEVNLGNSATYNMTLELFSGITNTFKLEVVNLPNQITHYFVDPSTQARLSQFKFTESSQTKRAGLQIFLPDRPTDQVKIEKPITFFVLAIPYEKLEKFRNAGKKNWTEDELQQMDIGYMKMELVPRGMGELLVKATQLYFSILPSDNIQVPVTVINEGSRKLNNIEFEIDLPLNWRREVDPLIIESLDIREERIVTFTFQPPDNVSVGKYEIRIRTTSLSDSQMEKAEDKTITVEIEQEANLIGTILIILLILGLISALVVFGIRLTRK